VHVEVDGFSLEVAHWAGDPAKPSIVLLHEGLGSVSAWGDFPEALCRRTGHSVVAYSRAGYGRSTIVREPFGSDYMHREAQRVLPAFLDALELRRPILFGHSDGASIALIFAAHVPNRTTALILEAPHVFVEELTIESIAGITAGYPGNARLRQGLARHHDDPDATFARWSEIWLHPAFRAWDITASLKDVDVPVLVLQGRDDEYGTPAQVEAIVAGVPSTETALLAGCRHAPHRDARETVLARTTAFLAGLSRA
jgi:pimeloyl-ACP methyl ester carboxylesterase